MATAEGKELLNGNSKGEIVVKWQQQKEKSC
jgi:hypothetical protein